MDEKPGWICMVCGNVYAPNVRQCLQCFKQTFDFDILTTEEKVEVLRGVLWEITHEIDLLFRMSPSGTERGRVKKMREELQGRAIEVNNGMKHG